MSIGQSGRIVLEISPELKRQLYSYLASEGMTLKDWFIQNASNSVENHRKLKLDLPIPDQDYGQRQTK